MAGSSEQWQRGDAYDAFMGRWSRLVADAFVTWVAAPSGSRWLDVGTGTGALSAAVIARADPLAVHGIDASPEFVDVARRQVTDDRAQFSVVDAHDLGDVLRGRFDLAVSGLVLNFLEPVGLVVRAMRGAVTPGGSVAGYVWDYRRMDLLTRFWDAATSMDPDVTDLDEAVRFSAWDAEHLAALWQDAGLSPVRTTAITVELELEGFDDYWRPFLGGQGPAGGWLATLDDRRRDDLRRRLESDVVFTSDAPPVLRATATAVAGVRQ